MKIIIKKIILMLLSLVLAAEVGFAGMMVILSAASNKKPEPTEPVVMATQEDTTPVLLATQPDETALPTNAPTDAPTEAPTLPPTEAPTEAELVRLHREANARIRAVSVDGEDLIRHDLIARYDG